MITRANIELSNMRAALTGSAAEQPLAGSGAQPRIGQFTGTDNGAPATSSSSTSDDNNSGSSSSVESGAVPLLTPAQASALLGCVVLATVSSLAGASEAPAARRARAAAETTEDSPAPRKRARADAELVASSPLALSSGAASPDSAAPARVQCTLPVELLADFDAERALYGHGIACPSPAAVLPAVPAAAPVAAVPGMLDAPAFYEVAVLPCESVCSASSDADESEDCGNNSPLFQMVMDDTLTPESFDFC